MPHTSSGKVLLVSWCLFVLIETSLYSGNLVASFTVDTDTNDISSIDELVNSDYTVGTFTQSIGFSLLQRLFGSIINVKVTVAYYTKNSTRPELRRLYNKMVTLSQNDDWIFNDDVDGQILRVKQQQHAYVVHRSVGEPNANQDCLMDMVGESITWAEERMAFGITKGSPMKKDIDKIMSAIKESGMLDVWWKRWTDEANSVKCNVAKTVKPISLLDVEGIVVVGCSGLALSLIVLLLEYYHRKKKKKECKD